MSQRIRFKPGLWLGLAAALLVVAAVVASPDAGKRVYLPVAVAAPPAPDCNVPGGTFAPLPVQGTDRINDAANDRRINLGLRDNKRVNEPLGFVVYGSTNDKAPQLQGMFGDRRIPAFTSAWQTAPNSNYKVTLLGLGTAPGEAIYAPDSNNPIFPNYAYLVLYADEKRITLHNGREDNLRGYVIHIEDVCVDPDLVRLYRSLNAAGRGSLPGLRGHQAFGRAIGAEVRVAVRDEGTWLDPRSCRDWWKGAC